MTIDSPPLCSLIDILRSALYCRREDRFRNFDETIGTQTVYLIGDVEIREIVASFNAGQSCCKSSSLGFRSVFVESYLVLFLEFQERA